LAVDIAKLGGAKEIWCIFDNTASGAAAANALDLKRRMQDLQAAQGPFGGEPPKGVHL
jgi:uncharacterized protein YecE (DUF72 family)